MSFSNKHTNNIGYTRIKDKFTQDIVYDCDAKSGNQQKFIKEVIEKFSMSWNRIITGQGKTKDYLYVKKMLFGIFIISMFVEFLIFAQKAKAAGDKSFIAKPKDVLKEVLPLFSYFNILYILICIITYSLLLVEHDKNIIPVLLTAIPDILSAIGFIMMIVN